MYDVAIIGGGPGGYAAALYAHNFGLSVALVERDLVGEARRIAPGDGEQGVEALAVALNRARPEAQHRGGLAAADLGAEGAGHAAVPAGPRGGLEKPGAGVHHPGAAAAAQGQR